jgi:hypothetical protein
MDHPREGDHAPQTRAMAGRNALCRPTLELALESILRLTRLDPRAGPTDMSLIQNLLYGLPRAGLSQLSHTTIWLLITLLPLSPIR